MWHEWLNCFSGIFSNEATTTTYVWRCNTHNTPSQPTAMKRPTTRTAWLVSTNPTSAPRLAIAPAAWSQGSGMCTWVGGRCVTHLTAQWIISPYIYTHNGFVISAIHFNDLTISASQWNVPTTFWIPFGIASLISYAIIRLLCFDPFIQCWWASTELNIFLTFHVICKLCTCIISIFYRYFCVDMPAQITFEPLLKLV